MMTFSTTTNCFHMPSRLAARLLCLVIVLMSTGCGNEADNSYNLPLAPTSFETRAARRAYDGAPPVIPHRPFGMACQTCHTESGKELPTIGIAPANPHLHHRREGSFTNCAQCHVFTESDDVFAENTFRGFHQVYQAADRAHLLAPPVIPHPTGMRSNCLACHTGPAARPEIKCSHPQRTNCMQCHLAVEAKNEALLQSSSPIPAILAE